MSSFESLRAYFQSLSDLSRGLLDRLPIPSAIQPIAQTFKTLKPAFDLQRSAEVERFANLKRPAAPAPFADEPPAGMNTIGILADRLTILLCKEWYLRNRQKAPARADAVRDEQIRDIIACLSRARPGHARLLEKVSSIDVDAKPQRFEEAYYGLLEANVLMWETQEMLYTRDMEAVPSEELRDYIRFFSQANMMRNACISASESLYWAHTGTH